MINKNFLVTSIFALNLSCAYAFEKTVIFEKKSGEIFFTVENSKGFPDQLDFKFKKGDLLLMAPRTSGMAAGAILEGITLKDQNIIILDQNKNRTIRFDPTRKLVYLKFEQFQIEMTFSDARIMSKAIVEFYELHD